MRLFFYTVGACSYRSSGFAHLAAQCEIPPYRAIPFRESIAEGGIAPIRLALIGYRASIAEIPLFWGGGGIAPPLRMLSKGEMLRKGGGGIAPNWPC